MLFRYKHIILLFILLTPIKVLSNNFKNDNSETIGQDSIYYQEITPVYIYVPHVFSDKEKQEYQRFLRLVYNIKKAYPYAKLASNLYKQLEDTLQYLPSKKAQKEYVEKMQKILSEKYESELRKLTITQGKLIIKLFYRETGNTTYQVIKELRGSFEAFFWQTLAKFFGSSLKFTYDPNGEDKDIEEIIQMIETGAL